MTLEANVRERIELFYSYSHKDESSRSRLERHLTMLSRQGVITNWHFRRISGGNEWKGEIESHLNSAHIILLLISPDFLASDYCNDVEVKRAMERQDDGEARVIPVILRPVVWEKLPFSKLQALPQNAKPIALWRNQDEAFVNVAEGIRQVVSELRLGQEDKVNAKQIPRRVSKVVLVEDDKRWRQRIIKIISNLGFEIEVYKNRCDELLSRLSRNDYDLLITDIVLEKASDKRDGYDLAAFARECNEQIRIIFISGIVDFHDVRRAFVKLKIFDFISKEKWDLPIPRFLFGDFALRVPRRAKPIADLAPETRFCHKAGRAP